MIRHRRRLLQAAALPAMLLLLAACGMPGIPQDKQGTITTESVQVAPGSHIEFAGRSTLPDGTCLHAQLSADGMPVAWWPAETCVEVEAGNWQVRVQLGENGVPQEMSREKQYVLHVWERDNPSVEAEPFWFDLSGPPEPSE
jgi:hypothetical protein